MKIIEPTAPAALPMEKDQNAREPLRREQVDLSALATEVLQACRERDPARVLEAHIEPGLQATGDRRLLRQVFDNLLKLMDTSFVNDLNLEFYI